MIIDTRSDDLESKLNTVFSALYQIALINVHYYRSLVACRGRSGCAFYSIIKTFSKVSTDVCVAFPLISFSSLLKCHLELSQMTLMKMAISLPLPNP